MLRNIIGPVFNFRNCVFFVVFWLVFQKSSSFCRENEIVENKNLKKTKKLDQFLTLKRAKIGPVFNFTAYIYIYMETDRTGAHTFGAQTETRVSCILPMPWASFS